MKKTINLLGWIGVCLTILTLVLTLLTTYQFTYVKYFNSYSTLQWCIFFTMIAWAVKMFDFKASRNDIMYPITCIVIAVGTMFFIFMKVY
jgi:putative effector of murein hydrolase